MSFLNPFPFLKMIIYYWEQFSHRSPLENAFIIGIICLHCFIKAITVEKFCEYLRKKLNKKALLFIFFFFQLNQVFLGIFVSFFY